MGRTPAHIDKTSKVKNFRSTDEFLVNFTTASLKYFNSLIDESGCADMPAFLEHIHRNSNLYDVGYLTFYTLVPYVQMCSAVRLGDWRKFESLLPVWLQLFVASDKTKYSSLILSWTRMIESFSPEWREAVWKASFGRLNDDGFHTGLDSILEWINHLSKSTMPGNTRTNAQVSSSVSTLNVRVPLIRCAEELLHMNRTSPDSEKWQSKTTAADVQHILNWFQTMFGENYTRRMTKHSAYSVLFDKVKYWKEKADEPTKKVWDTEGGVSASVLFQEAMNNFDAKVASIVGTRSSAYVESQMPGSADGNSSDVDAADVDDDADDDVAESL